VVSTTFGQPDQDPSSMSAKAADDSTENEQAEAAVGIENPTAVVSTTPVAQAPAVDQDDTGSAFAAQLKSRKGGDWQKFTKDFSSNLPSTLDFSPISV
jgi:hypothetical protein